MRPARVGTSPIRTHGQEQSEHGLVGVDGAEHREVGGSQRVPEEQVTGYGQHDGGQDVRPEIDTQRTERHASQEWQRERGQQSMRRDDGQERFGRALRELLLKDVGDRVGDDADDDREDGKRSDCLLLQ